VLINPGLRLRSAVCGTEVIVVRTSGADLDLRCGGHPMLRFDSASPVVRPAVDLAFSQGALLGKRYGEADLEILCTRPGQGSIAIGSRPLPMLEPRKLPSSD
jgi:hypothetical protein